jgi:hypothetical protein
MLFTFLLKRGAPSRLHVLSQLDAEAFEDEGRHAPDQQIQKGVALEIAEERPREDVEHCVV